MTASTFTPPPSSLSNRKVSFGVSRKRCPRPRESLPVEEPHRDPRDVALGAVFRSTGADSGVIELSGDVRFALEAFEHALRDFRADAEGLQRHLLFRNVGLVAR
jgi:hypothetical protein